MTKGDKAKRRARVIELLNSIGTSCKEIEKLLRKGPHKSPAPVPEEEEEEEEENNAEEDEGDLI